MIKVLIILCLIVLLGSFLRVYGLDRSPPSLNWDEAANGYNAYSILETGRDEYGVFLPIVLKSFGDYKSAIPAYLSIPFIKILGLSQVSVRLSSAFFGILSVILIFLIAKKIFTSSLVGLIAAFLFSIEPWSVHFFRTFFEGNFALFFFLLGLLFLLYSFENSRNLVLSFIFFGVSMYVYHSEKIIVPIFLILIVLLNRKLVVKNNKLSKNSLISLIIFTLILLPLLFINIFGSGASRLSTTSILSLWPPPLANSLNATHQINFLDLLFHNQFYHFFGEVIGRYVSYFSPMNLFIRQSLEPFDLIPNLAVLYPIEFILWLLGMTLIFKNFSQYKLLCILILIAPIPAVITWNWFEAHRVMPLLAMYSIVTAYGLYRLVKLLSTLVKSKHISFVFYSLFSLILVWNAFYLFDNLLVTLPMNFSGNWQPGFKETMPVVASYADKYNNIIIETSHAKPYVFTLFYSKYSPKQYLSEVDYSKINQIPRTYFDFGKYNFRNIYWPDDRKMRKTIFVGSIYSLPEADVKSQPNARIIFDGNQQEGSNGPRVVLLD